MVGTRAPYGTHSASRYSYEYEYCLPPICPPMVPWYVAFTRTSAAATCELRVYPAGNSGLGLAKSSALRRVKRYSGYEYNSAIATSSSSIRRSVLPASSRSAASRKILPDSGNNVGAHSATRRTKCKWPHLVCTYNYIVFFFSYQDFVTIASYTPASMAGCLSFCRVLTAHSGYTPPASFDTTHTAPRTLSLRIAAGQ
eukprot:scaffold34213_cov24-Prasinocladus_malaysianus.AAC.2